MANSLIVAFSRLSGILFFIFLVCVITDPITKSYVLLINGQKLGMRLIHRDYFSPYHDKSSTISHRANFAVKRSMDRYAYLKAKGNGAFLPHDDIRGPLVPNDNSHALFVNISIGTPPIPQLVVLDTGSHLFWVQCEPCKKCNRKTPNPIYDPRKSSSYMVSSCYLSYCNSLITGHCDANKQCLYFAYFGDSSYSEGVLGYENVTFQTSDEGIIVVPYVIFGCGTKSFQRWLPQSSGILGLSADSSSIIGHPLSRVGSKFSYCIGNISDPAYTYHQLILGDDAILDGQSTKFELRNQLYYLSLEGIRLGETEIKINPEEYKSNFVIDSGTTLTFLHPSTFELLKVEVRKILAKSSRYPVRSQPDSLCYSGDLRRDVKDFPVATIRLSGGVQLLVDVEGLFIKMDDYVSCLAFTPSKDKSTSILGLLAQQYYNVGFDVLAKTIYFLRIDCRFLET